MKETVLFIHGMFQNAKSWRNWVRCFSTRGYDCIAESWPLHVGEPADLRTNPPPCLGDLRLQTVIDYYAELIRIRTIRPIAVGHSAGGLVVQKLVELGVVRAGVAVASAAPNRMLAFDWRFLSYCLEIANPFGGDAYFEMTPDAFHRDFANTLTEVESNAAYEEFATYESRNVLRDCVLESGHIDLKKPHVPLLFIAAERDNIIPPQLSERNAAAYETGIANYVMFPNRGHFLCGEPGWEEVAQYAADWSDSVCRTA